MSDINTADTPAPVPSDPPLGEPDQAKMPQCDRCGVTMIPDKLGEIATCANPLCGMEELAEHPGGKILDLMEVLKRALEKK